MSLNLGINVVEVDGATPSIVGAPTSVAGFVIRSHRGLPGVVRQISNFTQFTNYFGGYVAAGNVNGTQTSYVGAYAVRGFFDNGGTLASAVTRAVDTTAAVPVPDRRDGDRGDRPVRRPLPRCPRASSSTTRPPKSR